MRRYLFPALITVLCLGLSSCAAAWGKPGKYSELDQPVMSSYAERVPAFDGRVQVIAYNVERGFFWEDVVNYIDEQRTQVPATIVLLSECDRAHSRTDEVFVADEMAKALNMDMVFVTEYVEYNDQTPENQGDHGNALLSPFPLSDISVIRHTTIYSWTLWGKFMGQPRFGERVALGATVELPRGEKIRVYSLHLESNSETIGKWIQMKEVIKDAERFDMPVVIGGDFNELPFGLMFGLLPTYGISNSFPHDKSPTGSCKSAGDRAQCKLKIDWIVHRGLQLIESSVDYPLNSQHEIISDHAPVRATYQLD